MDTGKGLQEMRITGITGLSCIRDLLQTSVIVHSIITVLKVFIHVLPHFVENQQVNLIMALGLILVQVGKTSSSSF